MNEANETLACIRRHKTMYRKKLNETTNIRTRAKLKEVIDELSIEEEKWIKAVME